MHHVILGNGPAGVIAAETIRKLAPRDYITLIGDEREPAYSRMAIPYLLAGNVGEDGTYLRKAPQHFDSLHINEFAGKCTSVDTAAKRVKLDNGTEFTYDRLLVATGSTPNKPPITGIDAKGIYPCWTLADARKIIADTKPGTRVLQMGAGFIGCIIMEALAARGVKLTVVEMGDRMVPRMMTSKAGGMIKTWVEGKGVKVHTNAKVESIMNGSPHRVKLSTGEVIEADVIITATGVRPNVGFLKDSGVKTNVGVVVDKAQKTNVDGIYAAGDVCEAPDFNTGAMSINAIQPNAAEQARIAASNMAGFAAKSDGSLQMNVLDTIGLIAASYGQWQGVPEAQGGTTVEHFDEKTSRYISLQFKGDVMIGATSLGLTDHVGVLRGLIQGRTPLGEWKGRLMKNPYAVMDAYLEKTQAQASNAGLTGGRLRT